MFLIFICFLIETSLLSILNVDHKGTCVCCSCGSAWLDISCNVHVVETPDEMASMLPFESIPGIKAFVISAQTFLLME